MKLSELTEEEQNERIKNLYFSEPSEDGKLILFFYDKNCIDVEKSIDILSLIFSDKNPDRIEKLVKQGQLIMYQEEGPPYHYPRYYLSDEGLIIARGIKKIYKK